jgi:hypothetical protein
MTIVLQWMVNTGCLTLDFASNAEQALLRPVPTTIQAYDSLWKGNGKVPAKNNCS